MHRGFNVGIFEYEKYTKLLRSEGAGGKLPVQTRDGHRPIAGKSKKQDNLGVVGVEWIYEILYKGEVVFNYTASDEYNAILDEVNDNEALDKMIKESWGRYTAKFEQRRMLVGIGNPLDDIEDFEVELIRESLKEHLAAS